MRNPFRRREKKPMHIVIPTVSISPVTVHHTITHRYEPRPIPEFYRLFWECDGVVYQSLWRSNTEYDEDVPSFITERSQSQGVPIRLRMQPVAEPRGYR